VPPEDKGPEPPTASGSASPSLKNGETDASAPSTEEGVHAAESGGAAPPSAHDAVPVANIVPAPTSANTNGSAAPVTVPEGFALELLGRTDVGLIREHNEDNFLLVRLDDGSRDPAALRKHTIGPRGTLLIVCDGMGGAAAGEVASNLAVESVAQTMTSMEVAAPPEGADDAKTALARSLRMAAKRANDRIFKEARENLARSGMGTTMTAAVLWDGYAIIAQVGDSRAYVWRQGAFTQVTRDQSLVNQLLETGQITPEQAKFFEHSNVILQALGVQEEVEVQLSQVDLCRGDRILLCSDGLVGVVSDEEIGAVLGATETPEEATRILIEMANTAGGPDNITVVVGFMDGQALDAPGPDRTVEYALWRIDPDPPPEPEPPAPVATPTPAPTAAAAPPEPMAPAATQISTFQLLSMAIVVGLVLGSLVTGTALYRRAVPCSVEAKAAGLAVLTDGRDSGARTNEGIIELRLSPGHHRLSLAGQGAPEGVLEVDVEKDARCALRFP
jgi:protein phosphatase